MCGIVGVVSLHGQPVDRALISAMTESLRRRGPDDQGIYVAGDSQGHGACVGLGHRRLSILDLSSLGHQPMSNEDGTVWVVFNGEIYNFIELRKELESKGHVFRSHSDTEVLVHGYEQYGLEIAARLKGMFAFGIWDESTAELHLVRDRMGKKPLYWMCKGNRFSFASEPKAFCADPGFVPEINIQSLSRYLQHEYVPSPSCIFEGVKKLPAGGTLSWKNGVVHESTYWAPSYPEPTVLSVERASLDLERLFREAVRRRLVSDVPLGVFLSGGIDSSAIVAFMSELMDPSSIRTFSIGFREDGFDESRYARDVAESFGTNHKERLLTAQSLLEILPDLWAVMDEPLADPSIIPTSLLSSFTREHVTVALGGDGGDELFAGYDPFLAQAPARWFSSMPGLFQRAANGIARCLPTSSGNMGLDFKLRQFLKGMDFDRFARQQVWLGSFSPSEREQVLHPDIVRELRGYEPLEDVRKAFEGREFRDETDEMLFFYQRFYLEGDILTKVDRASMAHSLEVRAPFLDADLVDYANALPSNMKLHGCKRKYALKRMLHKKLPKRILSRQKKGFGIPLAAWIKGDLSEVVLDVLSESRLKSEGIFNPKCVTRIIDEHMHGVRDNRKLIWTLMTFAQWREHFLAT